MKTMLLSLLILLSTWANASQIYGEAMLTKLSSSFGFKDATNVHLIVYANKDGEPKTMDLSWETDDMGQPSIHNRILEVTNIKSNSEGRLIYASLPSSGEEPHIGERLNLQLIDHSTSVLTIPFKANWEITVNHGYGWCGTGDSRMELVGNPL